MIENNAINLCNQTGVDAVELLLAKISDPQLPLRIGETVLENITAVEHYDDGQPVYTVHTSDDRVIIFQFEPGQEPFNATAVDQDGAPVCFGIDES